MASGFTTLWQIERENGSSDQFYVLGLKITVDCDCSPELKDTCPWKESYDKLYCCF